MEKNWSGSYTYSSGTIHNATSIPEAQARVASAARVRALGTRHSFSAIADSPGSLVTVTGVAPDFVLDETARTVTVGGGTRYGVLATFLEQHGWALHNLGSLPHISIAGAISTGTHGSGNRNGILSTAVSALDIITATGEVRTLRRGDPEFGAAVVGLGLFGVVVRVTLDIQPTFAVRQDVYRGLAWEELLDDLDGITGSAYSVSIFTDWVQPTLGRVWMKSRMDEAEPPADLRGAVRDPVSSASLIASSSDNLTLQGGVPGPWLERLPHFRLDATPSNGDEIQTEYFVPREQGALAVAAVRELGERIAPHLLVTELRTAAHDGIWLSPAYERDVLAIHFTWKNEPDGVAAVLPDIERALAPFGPRPHWGKFNTMDRGAVAAGYPLIEQFRAAVRSFDPEGKFGNEFLNPVINN